MTSQEIHDFAQRLLDNIAYYNTHAMYHANMAIVMSDAAKSMKRCLKELKKECKKRRNDERNKV